MMIALRAGNLRGFGVAVLSSIVITLVVLVLWRVLDWFF
jgi:hypothetical protein